MKILVFSAILMASGCTCYNYVGSPKYVPLNLEKDRTIVNIYASNLQIGQSFTNHLSGFISAHGRTARESKYIRANGHGGDSSRHANDRLIEFGGGYSVTKNRFILELMAGGGFGRSRYNSNIDAADYHFNYWSRTRSAFIQPNVGIKHPNFSVAVFSKITRWQFYDIESHIQQGGNKYFAEDRNFVDTKMLTCDFAEPGIQLQAGKGNVKFMAQLSGVVNLTGIDLRVRKTNFNLGCVIDLAPKFER